jgi:hypothetical protein
MRRAGAALKSPLVIGADPRSLSQAALRILKNKEVLEVSQDPLAKPVRLLRTTAAVPATAVTAAGPSFNGTSTGSSVAGTKLKMERCSSSSSSSSSSGGSVGDDRQSFVLYPEEATKCKQSLRTGAACITIRKASPGGGDRHSRATVSKPIAQSQGQQECATVLAERWPWWVSLLPCNASDPRQFWSSRPDPAAAIAAPRTQQQLQIVANAAAVRQPWPSSAKAGKCVNGSCPLEGCLEIEGANVEVDQCDWSTTPSQFLWELVTSGGAEHGGGGGGGGQLKNVLSGQCLTVRPLISYY